MPAIKKELSKWFDIPNDAMGGSVLVRHLNDGLRRDSEKKSDGNSITDIELKCASAIVDWKNHFDGNPTDTMPHGKELECNAANKHMFLREDGYCQFIIECFVEMAKEAKAKNEILEKN